MRKIRKKRKKSEALKYLKYVQGLLELERKYKSGEFENTQEAYKELKALNEWFDR
jgi:hypothetical protein